MANVFKDFPGFKI